MFTKNWYKLVSNYLFSGYDNDYFTTMEGAQLYVRPADITVRICSSNDDSRSASLYKMRTSYSGSGGVFIGTGVKEPTIDDYAMSGNLITGYTYSVNITKSFDGAGATVTALYTITNTSSTAFTIGEIGLLAELNNTYKAADKALLERSVLDSTLTIEPGGVGQLTYVLHFDYPTN